MSTSIPVRAVRLPALQRQCLFQRRQILDRTSCAARPFSSTTSRHRGQKNIQRPDRVMTKAAAENQTSSPAPRVNFEHVQSQAGMMADDIGLLQDTIVRASLGKLPNWWTTQFWGYFWKLVKSKGTALYSRGAYKRCIYKKGMSSYLPIDAGNKSQIKDTAQKLYEQMYHNFAKGNIHPVQRFCLPPIARDLNNRISARGPLKMDWKLHKFNSTRIMSHRASPLGEDHPDTAYRQVVLRLVSTQSMSMHAPGMTTKSSSSKPAKHAGLRWVPDEVKQREVVEETAPEKDVVAFADNGKTKKVTEYFVLQRKVVNGKEDDEWKIWGFADESTPQKMLEDEEYWRKTLTAQAATV